MSVQFNVELVFTHELLNFTITKKQVLMAFYCKAYSLFLLTNLFTKTFFIVLYYQKTKLYCKMLPIIVTDIFFK